MPLLGELRKYLGDALPGGALNPEWSPDRRQQALSLAQDFTPVWGGIKGAREEMAAGNPGWAAFNAATVPLDLASMGLFGLGMKAMGKGMKGVKAAADLPMDQASRMARAKDLGFDTDRVWYHGANRLDRLLEAGKINPKRATSGPMPFFTDDPNIASSYAKGKTDTSRLNDYDFDYSDWFKIKVGKGKPKRLDQAWWYLTPQEKSAITDKIGRVTQSDDMDSFFIGEGPGGQSHWDWALKENRGNALSAAKDVWLDSGNLFNDEEKFLDVLKLGGLNTPAIYDSPFMSAPGVLPVYARISNPLDTSNVDQLSEVLDRLKYVGKRKRYKQSKPGVDAWDKKSIGIREFTDRLADDLKNGTNYAWTSIPDEVTYELQDFFGFDGILDKGGKYSGEGHNVLIPFKPNQVRSTNAAFDPAKKDSADLLAQWAGLGLLGGGLGAGVMYNGQQYD